VFQLPGTESLAGGGSPFDRRSGTANRRRWACEKLLACGGHGWRCERDAGLTCLTCYCGAPWIEGEGFWCFVPVVVTTRTVGQRKGGESAAQMVFTCRQSFSV
jgi:hypothetical protein